MALKQKRGLTKMLEMFGGMTAGLEPEVPFENILAYVEAYRTYRKS